MCEQALGRCSTDEGFSKSSFEWLLLRHSVRSVSRVKYVGLCSALSLSGSSSGWSVVFKDHPYPLLQLTDKTDLNKTLSM